MNSRILWPRSMFWRLSLVLVGGVVLIQCISLLWIMGARIQYIVQMITQSRAPNIAANIRLLETGTTNARDELLPLLADKDVSIQIQKTPPHLPAKTDEVMSTNIFLDYLKQNLPPGTPVIGRVDGVYMGFRNDPSYVKLFIINDFHDYISDFAYTVGVRLNDGNWAVFSHAIPQQRRWIDAFPLIVYDLITRNISIAIISLLGVRWLIRPLTVLAKAADKLGEDIHQPPLPETGPREIVRAAKAFNRMQARIRSLIDERGRMLAAVSHDLKTPITRMRLRADHIAAPDLQDQFVADLDEMSQMLDMSIEFVRSADNGEGLAEVDVMALLESLADDYAEMGSPVRVRGTAGAPLRAQPQHLKRCLTNLIENGLRYGGEVDIEVRDTPAAMTIVIADNGPGIPPELLDKVFEPFFRVENSRSRMTGGSGLGLSIARNIARLHGGDVVLANKPEGGLESRLTLPRTCAK